MLQEGRPLLMDLGGTGVAEAAAPWASRVPCVRASCDGHWELPALGAVTPPTGVLIRPNGHVAWVGEGHAQGLAEAMSRRCGPALA